METVKLYALYAKALAKQEPQWLRMDILYRRRMVLMKMHEGVNEYGTAISVHKCSECNNEFTVCPPTGDDWGGCLSTECKSYDPARDADGLFGGGV